jgi:hypothetical protein
MSASPGYSTFPKLLVSNLSSSREGKSNKKRQVEEAGSEDVARSWENN